LAATDVLPDFDRTRADAEVLLNERPVIPSLSDAQIKRITETYYAASWQMMRDAACLGIILPPDRSGGRA